MDKKTSLITVSEALRIVLGQTEDFGIEEVDFNLSLGRVLKESIKADRDLPPFDRVSMDGIALNSKIFNSGQREYHIENIQPAGSKQLSLENEANCIEAMTGGILPKGTDAVIPYELISLENSVAKVKIDEIRYFQNIHKKGLDRKQGEELIPINTKISSAEIGVLATVGKNKVKVARNPKIAIISTGDELVNVDQTPEPYQIRKSNVHTLSALLQNENLEASIFHITDNKALLKSQITHLLNVFDVLMFSGAVSKGKFDFLPEVLDELGVEKYFHKVKQRPGKPFWFGKKNKATIFAFPGNPVSTFVSCLKYFMPWYLKSQGLDYTNRDHAFLGDDVTFKPELTYFLQVKINNEEGRMMANPVSGNGSGDLANLTLNDAFLELPADKDLFKKGEIFPIIQYRH
ncbi:MAG: molybdopterin molybdotransferase MoeA [Flavobacteriaceae bacterium]|nr:MAG: molybdopterin molybdotransferase MoeA [Flavobacteriaceae bacterium]